MKQGALLPMLVMVGLGAGEHAEAGTFRITSVQYEVWPLEFNGKQIRVLVLGSAKYSGKLDLEDTDWEIQTFLNDDIGGDLDDWDNPDWWGYGNTGTTIPYSGYEIFCDLACAADAAVSKCDVQETSVTYKGKAGVTIYHPFFPEIDIGYARPDETECLKFSVGGSVTDLPTGALERDLILQNNGADDLVISKNGSFTFPEELVDGEAYDVTVLQHPVGKRCLVDSGSRVIDSADVTDVQVRCWNFCQATYSVVSPPGDFAAAEATNCVTAGLVDKGDGTVADPLNNLLWTKEALKVTGTRWQLLRGKSYLREPRARRTFRLGPSGRGAASDTLARVQLRERVGRVLGLRVRRPRRAGLSLVKESRTMELVLPGGIRLYCLCVVRSPGTCNQLRVGLQLPIVQQREATRRLDGGRELHASTLRDRRPVGVTLVR
jgi:hypothetical protein